MKFLFSLSVLLLFYFRAFSLTDNSQYKSSYLDHREESYKRIISIYDNITRVVGDKRERPSLEILKSEYYDECGGKKYGCKFAWIGCFNNPKIIIEADYLNEIFRTFNDDYMRECAIAFTLGHELAHYYKGHLTKKLISPLKNFISPVTVDDIFKRWKNKDTIYAEIEADYIGGFYCYAAGYDIRKILTKTIDSIIYKGEEQEKVVYSSINPLNEGGYLHYKYRRILSDSVISFLNELIPIFEAGNNLLIIKEYKLAAMCFEKVKDYFPSKDILNNLGVCYAQLGLAIMDIDHRKWIYPFSFDSQSQIKEALIPKAPPDYLNNAKGLFKQAITLDSNYYGAYINLGSIHLLQGDINSFESILNLLINTPDRKIKGSILILKGIREALNGDNTRSESYFKEAFDGNPNLAEGNLNILRSSDKKNKVSQPLKKLNLKLETICGVGLNSGSPYKNNKLRVVHISENYTKTILTLLAGEEDQNCFALQIRVSVDDKVSDTLYFITGNAVCQKESLHGVKIADNIAIIDNLYGKEDYNVVSFQGSYQIYTRQDESDSRRKYGIFFILDDNNRVRSWILFEGYKN